MATPELIELKVVTPEGVALEASVREFTAPSAKGDFGVLPGHLPLMAAVRTGILDYVDEGGEQQRVAVGKGFIEVQNDRAVLLTDRYIAKGDVDAVRARLELKDADEEIDGYTGEIGSPEYLDMVIREVWAATQLELYGDPPPAKVQTVSEFQEPVDYEHLALTADDQGTDTSAEDEQQ